MILEVFLLLQVLAILSMVLVFFAKTPLASAVTVVLSGILMVGSWTLNVGSRYVWDPSIRAYVEQSIMVSTPYLATFNILIFGLAILYFFSDVMEVMNEESSHINLDKMNQRGNGGDGLQ